MEKIPPSQNISEENIPEENIESLMKMLIESDIQEGPEKINNLSKNIFPEKLIKLSNLPSAPSNLQVPSIKQFESIQPNLKNV